MELDRPSRRWVAVISPPCLRNWFLPKLVHLSLVVMGVLDPVTVDLEEFDSRDGWILEINIDRHGGTEVSPLLVYPLVPCILSIDRLHGFLHIVGIMQDISSVEGG